jgi:biopolymer transport protein ExbB
MQSYNKIKTASIILLSVLAANYTQAQAFNQAQTRTDTDLRQAVETLSQVRQQIEKEKLPLSTKIATLEAEVIEVRRERNRLLKQRDSRTLNLDNLRGRVSSLRDQQNFIVNRLNEFIGEFEARIDLSEIPFYMEQLEQAKLVQDDVDVSQQEKRLKQVELVEAAIERIDAALGGQKYEGKAMTPSGKLEAGTFLSLGPQVYFASQLSESAGIVEREANNPDAVVASGFTQKQVEAIQAVAQNGTGQLPLDPTLGKALKKAKVRKSLIGHIQDGGVVGYCIIALGGLSLLLALFKIREITNFQTAKPSVVDEVLNALIEGDEARAITTAKSVPGVCSQMLLVGIERITERREIVEELLFQKILEVRPNLERFLAFLALSAAAAPLMGLLGTVIGMIKTFQLITIYGTGDPKGLASGISEALVTTEFGLIVAIPILVVHGLLSRMSRQKIGQLEQVALSFVNGIHGIQNKDS